MKTNIKIDENGFQKILFELKAMQRTKKNQKDGGIQAGNLPTMIGIKLTNRCNLRCKHCYEWSDTGFHNTFEQKQQEEEFNVQLLLEIVKDLPMAQTAFYLWGGEPLLHKKFQNIIKTIEPYANKVVICTNGILVKKHIDSLLSLGDRLEIMFALDGFEAENDFIRGKGTYQKVVNAIQTLNHLKKAGQFKGQIVVNTVINENMAGCLHQFALHLEELQIDSSIFCFPWYISEKKALEMDQYYFDNLSFLQQTHINKPFSWHSFQYNLNDKIVEKILQQIDLLSTRVWNMRVRIFPHLHGAQVKSFIQGEVPSELQDYDCSALFSRVDILPNGSVTPCKQFPELAIGNVYKQSLVEIWKSEVYNEFRKTITQKLMPVCAQCNVFYLHNNM